MVRPAISRVPKGLCPVCRAMQRLIMATGKVGVHGKTAANPRGCPGQGERPLRVGRTAGGGATVVGFRPGDAEPTANPGDPSPVEIEIRARPETMSPQARARRLSTETPPDDVS